VAPVFDQVHFKHEQPQVLSPDSHVTIGSLRFSKHRTQPTCFEYIDTIVGMRLDHTEIHGNSLEDPSVINTESD